MSEDRAIKTAFLITFAGHCLLLGTPGFNLRLPQPEKQPEELTVEFEIKRPALLPKIDILGQEKKFKKIEPEPEPELKSPLLSEQITVQQISQERIKEKVNVIDPSNDAMLRYQDMVKQKIEQVRRYPLWAKKQGIEGVVFLNFIILPDGLSQDIKIIRSSGSGILDEEAVETVKRAVPFPLIPKEISSSWVEMGVSIVFMLH